ncbi:unnamed protein product [Ambrosiozyma monospora]|uniref:Unnamed protein product n=1 Tax=Ambrosiozyma monospora TaxID=43982 RepID=A0ACB5TTP9_AMBMO|nr:unnamed protein product [Ambrosiozyma monospora]
MAAIQLEPFLAELQSIIDHCLSSLLTSPQYNRGINRSSSLNRHGSPSSGNSGGVAQERDPHVRRALAYAIARSFDKCAPETKVYNLKLLVALLNDTNGGVVGGALAALNDIMERRGGDDNGNRSNLGGKKNGDNKIKNGSSDLLSDDDDVYVSGGGFTIEGWKLTISFDQAVRLCGLLATIDQWTKIYVLNTMMCFVPQNQRDSLTIIEYCIPYLQSENCSIALNALKVIVYLGNYVEHLVDQLPVLPSRISGSVSTLMGKSPEVQFLVMRNIILLLLNKSAFLTLDVRMFFCQYDDPIYIKDTKLEIIFLLANEQNIDVSHW